MKPQQLELFQVNPTWFHFFNEVIRSGAWAKMSLAAKALYPCLKSFCNYADGLSYPSIATLAEYSGLTIVSVVKAVKELEELGYITRLKSKGKTTRYIIQETIQPRGADGQPVGAPIRFDYVPELTNKAIAQIKDFVKAGMQNGEAFPLLNIIITNQYVNNSLQVINTIDVDSLVQGTLDRFEGRDTEAARYAASVGSSTR
jgi:DNA-binding transcriptional regulator YhcF (GntR family)